MQREIKTATEIWTEITRIASAKPETEGLWKKGAYGLPQRRFGTGIEECNWELVLATPVDECLELALRDAASEVQKRWNLAVPFLGSSAVAM